MMEYTWLRHRQRMEEIESLARSRAMVRAGRADRVTSRAPLSLRRRIGYGIMRIGARIAAGAGA
jgi:hypothetical protein